ncbi:MAG: DNA replication and repair protein RecF [Candidatus Neomarinimicrobiota bacterium]
MSIKKIDMISFRNHNHIELEFGSGINVIWGENGSGKTSILEAIYLLAIGRSFRTRRLLEIISDEKEQMAVTGSFYDGTREQTITFNQTRTGQRKIKINGTPAAGIREIIGKNPVVLLSPEEQNITKGSPGDRRTYFDKLFSMISRQYLNILSDYTRILKQRNALLRQEQKVPAGIEFTVWNEELSRLGVQLWEKRAEIMSSFQAELGHVSKKYTSLEIKIETMVSSKMLDQRTFMSELKKRENRDKILGWTSIGPHRDEMSFLFNQRPLREFGSQGEHKIALVFIKLAELQLIQKEKKQTPTLLLDDLFAKLDIKRSEAIFDLLSGKAQTLITNTDLLNIEKRGIRLTENDKTFCLTK